MINEQNYEAWFLDFLEGRLSEARQQALQDFLARHPHLRDELEQMQMIYLEPELHRIPKDDLKAPAIELPLLDRLLIAELEGDLTPRERRRLQALMQRSPVVSRTRRLYQMVRLHPEDLSFPAKDRLKRRPVLRFNYKVYAAAAALVLAAVLLFLWRPFGPGGSAPAVAHVPAVEQLPPVKPGFSDAPNSPGTTLSATGGVAGADSLPVHSRTSSGGVVVSPGLADEVKRPVHRVPPFHEAPVPSPDRTPAVVMAPAHTPATSPRVTLPSGSPKEGGARTPHTGITHLARAQPAQTLSSLTEEAAQMALTETALPVEPVVFPPSEDDSALLEAFAQRHRQTTAGNPLPQRDFRVENEGENTGLRKAFRLLSLLPPVNSQSPVAALPKVALAAIETTTGLPTQFKRVQTEDVARLHVRIGPIAFSRVTYK